MRKKFVTRTFKFEKVEVTVYNKEQECLEVYNLTLREMPEKDKIKEIEERFDNCKVVDIRSISKEEKIVKLSEYRFIEEAEREEAEEKQLTDEIDESDELDEHYHTAE